MAEKPQARLVEIQIGKDWYDSRVLINGAVAPVTSAKIELNVGEMPVVELTMLKCEGVEMSLTVLRGCLVDAEEYRAFEAWRNGNDAQHG